MIPSLRAIIENMTYVLIIVGMLLTMMNLEEESIVLVRCIHLLSSFYSMALQCTSTSKENMFQCSHQGLNPPTLLHRQGGIWAIAAIFKRGTTIDSEYIISPLKIDGVNKVITRK